MKKYMTHFAGSAGLLLLFVCYTAAVKLVDVKPVGPQNSPVGFAAMNKWVHDLLGVNMRLYKMTDWLGLVAIVVAMGFAVLGLVQLVKRKSVFRVDSSILALGGFYLLVGLGYLFFELYIINFRPVLIDGVLEASYPSSTTMLVMCIMPTAIMQLCRLVYNKTLKILIIGICSAFTAFMVIGRLLSGVHWLTDILGGILLSAALVTFYAKLNQLFDSKHGV